MFLHIFDVCRTSYADFLWYIADGVRQNIPLRSTVSSADSGYMESIAYKFVNSADSVRVTAGQPIAIEINGSEVVHVPVTQEVPTGPTLFEMSVQLVQEKLKDLNVQISSRILPVSIIRR